VLARTVFTICQFWKVPGASVPQSESYILLIYTEIRFQEKKKKNYVRY